MLRAVDSKLFFGLISGERFKSVKVQGKMKSKQKATMIPGDVGFPQQQIPVYYIPLDFIISNLNVQ